MGGLIPPDVGGSEDRIHAHSDHSLTSSTQNETVDSRDIVHLIHN